MVLAPNVLSQDHLNNVEGRDRQLNIVLHIVLTIKLLCYRCYTLSAEVFIKLQVLFVYISLKKGIFHSLYKFF